MCEHVAILRYRNRLKTTMYVMKVSEVFFKIKLNVFSGYFDPKIIFLDHRNKKFRGDLSDISAKKA